jgi:hypothetical protein
MRAIDSLHEITPKNMILREKFQNFTYIYFPESGSRKHFHASGMRAIDFSHKITPIRVISEKIMKKIFLSDLVAMFGLPLR